MHKSCFKKGDMLNFNQAVAKIKLNDGIAFEWFAIKNTHGDIFEVGGNNRGELIIYIRIPDQSDPFNDMNDFMVTLYYVTNGYIHPDDGCFLAIDKMEEFVNLSHATPRIEVIEKVEKIERVYYVKQLKFYDEV